MSHAILFTQPTRDDHDGAGAASPSSKRYNGASASSSNWSERTHGLRVHCKWIMHELRTLRWFLDCEMAETLMRTSRMSTDMERLRDFSRILSALLHCLPSSHHMVVRPNPSPASRMTTCLRKTFVMQQGLGPASCAPADCSPTTTSVASSRASSSSISWRWSSLHGAFVTRSRSQRVTRSQIICTELSRHRNLSVTSARFLIVACEKAMFDA